MDKRGRRAAAPFDLGDGRGGYATAFAEAKSVSTWQNCSGV